ncbi:hypothetical protein ABG768_021943 [Culter alburnus]|uniref:Uncharacterized protein n=1 Tax=Culter alburnus TaxID=194366 RepID=A0AAW2AXB7_CULAL
MLLHWIHGDGADRPGQPGLPEPYGEDAVLAQQPQAGQDRGADGSPLSQDEDTALGSPKAGKRSAKSSGKRSSKGRLKSAPAASPPTSSSLSPSGSPSGEKELRESASSHGGLV